MLSNSTSYTVKHPVDCTVKCNWLLAHLPLIFTGTRRLLGITQLGQSGNILSSRLIMKRFLLSTDSRRAVVSF